MKAYVINLPETVDRNLSRVRRRHIETELAHAGLPYEFVPCVDGPSLTARERAEIVDEGAVAQHPWLTPGVIGAALSHVQAYREIRDRGDRAALILEDDSTLATGLREVLEELSRHLARSEIVLLYWRTFPDRRLETRCEFSSQSACELREGQRVLFPIDLRRLCCASAYVITADACETMTEALLPIRANTDSWAWFHMWGGFDRLRCFVPRLVGVRSDFKSTVGYLESAPTGRPNVSAEAWANRSVTGRMAESVSAFVAHRRLFPIYQLLGLRRARIEREMSRFDIVDEPSPLAR